MQCFKVANKNLYYAAALQSELNLRQIMNLKNDAKVIVIGAGLAGLSAANHLIKNGFHRTLLLEATERYGGRIKSKQFGDTYCELGAKWISIDGSANSIYEFLRHSDGPPAKLKQEEKLDYVDLYGHKVNRKMAELIDLLFRKLCSGFKMSEKYKTGDLSELDNVMVYFQAESAKVIKTIFKEDEQALASFIFNSLFKKFGSILGCCLEYVNIEHITKVPVQTESTQPLYIPTGLDSIIEQLVDNIAPSNLRIGKPVGQIQWQTNNFNFSEDAITVPTPKVVGCLDGTLFKAHHIICTLPLGVLKNFSGLLFKPNLPKEKEDAIRNLGFGNPIKIYLEYDRGIDRWFKVNLRPLCNSAQKRLNKIERLWTDQVVEIAKVPSSRRVLEVQVGGGYYDEIEKLPDVQVLKEVTRLLRNCLRNKAVPYPISILRSNWSTSACYLGGRPYFSIESTSNDVTKLAYPLGEKVPTLLFAGDATILNGFGTIDGARLSGIREAQRIIDYYRLHS